MLFRSSARRRNASSSQCRPRDYYVNALKCLELSLNSCDDGFSKLDELQAVILLAHFALFQPVAPTAYLTEVAMRTAMNTRLYCEDEADASFVEGYPSHTQITQQDRLRDLRGAYGGVRIALIGWLRPALGALLASQISLSPPSSRRCLMIRTSPTANHIPSTSHITTSSFGSSNPRSTRSFSINGPRVPGPPRRKTHVLTSRRLSFPSIPFLLGGRI